MKSLNLTFLMLIFGMVTSFSQDLLNTQALVTSNTGLIYEIDRSDKTIQGFPYIEESFQPARVTADIEQIFNARYNAVSDQIEVETDKKNIQAINKLLPGIKVVFLKDSKTYVGTSYFNEEGASVSGFLIPLTNPNMKVKLFKQEKKIYIERQPAKSSYQEARPAKFERIDDVYYISINNEIAKPITNKKKEIAALFPNQEKDILKHIGSEKLNVKNEDDLIKLVTYLNSLSL